ncbi:MAG: ImmA/IrrE family metallo-endopeptidase [Parvibaculaceae bacterium]|nr:ImmA/IrrE family metallo-endopeptidase [Parvibaculaceae bacterium]
MASEDEENSSLDVVVRLAKRVCARHDLVPRVDAFAVAANYAEVEECAFPFPVDGISVDLKLPGKRPKILVREKQSQRRKRFTVAHELGHVVIPWHIGTIVDHVDGHGGGDDAYWIMENEANTFASELLIPSDWLKAKVASHDGPFAQLHLEVIEVADVSAHAAAIALLRVLPPGFVFAICDSSGEISEAGRSRGTMASAPHRGSYVREIPKDTCLEYSQARDGGKTVNWWLYGQVEIPTFDEMSGDWRECLNEIVESLTDSSLEQAAMKKSINGVIGFANSQARPRVEEVIYGNALQRFSAPAWSWFRTHPLFTEFLVKRVKDLKKS